MDGPPEIANFDLAIHTYTHGAFSAARAFRVMPNDCPLGFDLAQAPIREGVDGDRIFGVEAGESEDAGARVRTEK